MKHKSLNEGGYYERELVIGPLLVQGHGNIMVALVRMRAAPPPNQIERQCWPMGIFGQPTYRVGWVEHGESS